MTRAANVLMAIALAIGVVTGCARRPTSPADDPTRAVARVHPPDWFHRQLTAARAAKRAHQPKTDTAGAQMAFDDVMRTACTRAALAGPGKYPARCDAVLRPTPVQPLIDPCDGNPDDPTIETECND